MRAESRPAFLRWGLIPPWAKDPKIGNRMINARAETVAEKPSFRRALARRRCLVLSDGFFEWRKHGCKKTPVRVVLKSGEPFAFRGTLGDLAAPRWRRLSALARSSRPSRTLSWSRSTTECR